MEDSLKTKHWDITQKIIECSMNVHNSIGCGFQEIIYHNALRIEFTHQHMLHKGEVDIPIFYRGIQVGTRRVDFIVNDLVMIEIKACSELLDVHFAQAINYLEASRFEIGLLINFGSEKLQIKRLYNNQTTRIGKI
jgi:GxxExxY protein